jgi:integrase
MKLFMTEKNIEGLLKVSEPWARDHAIFHTALATGFRASDLLNLKRWDVAPQGAVVHSVKIKMVKTGKMVERQLPKTCREALERYLNTRGDNNSFLFYSESNNSLHSEKPMNHSSLHRMFKRYLGMMFSQETLKGNACHTTRRSMAKIISDKSGSILPASRFLGHTGLSSTVAYLDADAASRQADEIVSSFFS